VKSCLSKAEKKLQQDFTMPAIFFNQRGKIAGSARLQKNELKFNPVLLNDNLQVFLDEVVAHEVGHLITFQLFGKVKPHGKEWQQIMTQVLNVAAKPYHDMNVEKVKGKTFIYQCQCGPTELGIRRHNKVVRGTQQYSCKRCRQILVRAM
jgi:SprT protein